MERMADETELPRPWIIATKLRVQTGSDPDQKKSHNKPRSSKGIWIRPAQTMKHRNIKTSSTNGWWISGTHTTKSAQNLAVPTRCESEQPKKPNRQTKTMNTSRLSIRGTQTTKLAPNNLWVRMGYES